MHPTVVVGQKISLFRRTGGVLQPIVGCWSEKDRSERGPMRLSQKKKLEDNVFAPEKSRKKGAGHHSELGARQNFLKGTLNIEKKVTDRLWKQSK